ncbi:lycopene cyclase [Gemmatimonadetes bacterium T265]|nr:lycopene cyclase [Gemmatimonadetes bacterium T265]
MRADVAIVGAGCAGLSLAARLADAGPRAGRVVLLDERTTFARDRTWCFWDVHPHPFAAAVTHRWARWRVRGPDCTDVVRTSTRYAYQHVPADAFYAAALARVAAAPHVELRLGERADAVADARDARVAVVVHTTHGALHAAHVFDSRPGPPPARADQLRAGYPDPRPHATRLVQAFAGAVVRTAAPVFDAGTATLMDFTADQPGDGFPFGYVLPYSAHEALVELAMIAERAPTAAVLEAALARYAARLTGGVHVTRSREAGVIPMDAALVERRPSPRVTRIGVAGGMAKPSTGYAFLAIQRDSAALARAVVTSVLGQASRPRGSVARWLDHVFLRRLHAAPTAAPALFTRLFAVADPDALVRFLSDVGSPGDAARVITALPPLPFVAEACRLAAA